MNTRGQNLVPARKRSVGNKGKLQPNKPELWTLFGPNKNRVTNSMIAQSRDLLKKRKARLLKEKAKGFFAR